MNLVRIRSHIPVVIPALTGILFMGSLLAVVPVQKKIGIYNYLQAWHYHELALHNKANPLLAQRYTAIADALFHGHTDYHYTTNLTPPASK